ncbi:MAG TPA: inorganic triphosphatase, partial [Paraburkholderia sp.]|nr:inorganic triphosphatase [Paraburkholderia sp.]
MERELKLRTSSEDLAALRHAPLLLQKEGAEQSSQLLTSTYFDTPGLSLHWCGASLRVRAAGDRRIQTMKLETPAQSGLFERDEFEMPVDGDAPELALLHSQISGDTDIGKLIRDDTFASQLKPVFVTRIKRAALPLSLPSGDEIEVALDEGSIDAESGSIRVAAVELELKEGRPDSLYGFALQLLETAALRIDHHSKADLGYSLLIAEHAKAVKAQPVQLDKGASVEDAFCAIVRSCLNQVHANERGVVSGHDPSSVHQMRVGLRRLRSAFDLFAKVIPAYPGLDDELRWIAAELGAARDWEVLAG